MYIVEFKRDRRSKARFANGTSLSSISIKATPAFRFIFYRPPPTSALGGAEAFVSTFFGRRLTD
jgi:hypothetical protein